MSDSDSEGPATQTRTRKKKMDLRNPDVVNKYHLAAEITNAAMKKVIEGCVDGASIFELCAASDAFIKERTDKLFPKNKELLKGVGFPTCIAVNEVVGAFSPFSKNEDVQLKAGDIAKIELGCQVDGFLTQAGHTIVVPGGGKVTGRVADALKALHTAFECFSRLIKPGTKNEELTSMLAQVADEFKCKPVQGVFSHRVKRYEVDEKAVIENAKPDTPPSGDDKILPYELDVFQAWSIDIVLSTGSGKPTAEDDRITVYRKVPEAVYKLKIKASRSLFSEITQKFPVFPFNLRATEVDEQKARMGVVECSTHGLLEPYPILREKTGEIVVQSKFTVLILPEKSSYLTGEPIDLSNVESAINPTSEEIKTVLQLPKPMKKKKKKSKKKGGAATTETKAE